MKILLIAQSFMAPKIGSGKNNYGGTEAFINNFCIAYHRYHSITILGTDDIECDLENVTVIRSGNYSRAYLEEQSGTKARCNNGGIVAKINQVINLGDYDIVIDNTTNKVVCQSLSKNKLKNNSLRTRIFSIAHSRPSYAGRGVDETVKWMSELTNTIDFISVTKESVDEWNKLSYKVVGRPVFKGYTGLRILDKNVGHAEFSYSYDYYSNQHFVIIGRIDPVKNFGQFNQFAAKNPRFNFSAWALLIPCGQKCYDELHIDKLTGPNSNLKYYLNKSINEKELFIRTNNAITCSTSISENGGTTCIESMMWGLPIVVVNHRENGCRKYVLDGEVKFKNEQFTITSHGILLENLGGLTAANLGIAYDKARELEAFDRKAIREYFKENLCFNENFISQLYGI